MSLHDIDKEDEEYEELAPKRKRGRGIGKKIFGKTKIFLLIFVIGLLVGAFIGIYYIEPILAEAEGSTCKACLASKELLTKENDCLYSLVEDATTINSCKAIDQNT
ncbi:MAG: hypothetical protein HON47_03880 [Candidatus Diapherotrites archaeon]|uniref:Uncharacterized protein n=1 Tax=Candidatus Iainarchaeum sp. TaxID=3101447 RepID=A0A8T5GG45_9ARCH|nr:hypothetical protein [Candidatus Diapherotrites archaeon]MBT7241687.1 hypothetical protein [Candidatus Diapherotrites archaeon]